MAEEPPAPAAPPPPLGPRRLWGLAAGLVVFAALLYAPLPDGLTPEGRRALAVMGLCVTWWFTAPVDLPVTAIVGMALLPVLGVLDPPEAFALFGNQAVFFIVGVFLCAAVVLKTGLSNRLALGLLRPLATSEDRLAGGLLVLSTALCAVVVSHAVAALLLPIVLELIAALDLRRDGRLSKRLVLSMVWGTILGSNLTLLGSARAGLALGFLDDYRDAVDGAAAAIGFADFTVVALPVVVLGTAATYLVLRWAFPPEGARTDEAVAWLQAKVDAQGPASRDERLTAVVVAAMVVAMIAFGDDVGMGSVALLFSAVLLGVGVLDWDGIERYVSWGTVLLFGGAIVIAGALERTGVAAWIVAQLLPGGGDPNPWLVIAGIGWLAVILTELASNSAVVVLLLPIALRLGGDLGIDPRAVVYFVVLPSGMAHVLPTSTPAMALGFSTGFVQTRDLVLPGLLLNHLCLAALLACAAVFWPELIA